MDAKPSVLTISDLKTKNIVALTDLAKSLDIEGGSSLRKQELIFETLKSPSDRRGLIFAEGVLETLPDGYGFLRTPHSNYLPGPDDVYVSPSQISKFYMRTGDTISGQ